MKHRIYAVIVVVAAAIVPLTLPQTASSAPQTDPRTEREQVRAEQATLASKLNISKASKAEIDEALEALQADLDAQQAALDKAKSDLADARRELEEAEEAITALTEEISILRDEASRRAILAYVNPPEDDLLSTLAEDDFTTATEQRFYAEFRMQDDADLEDRLQGAQVDLDAQRERAAEAEERAVDSEKEQGERTRAVEEAKERQDDLAAELQASINAQIARSLELAETDRELSAKIAEEQAELQARLAMQQAAEKKRAEEKAAEQRMTLAAAGPSPATPGPATTAPPPPPPVTAVPGGSTGGIQIAYVQGVPVNAQVATQVVAMVEAAAADGVSLRLGNSYRTIPHQIELRKQNCGTSHYAIYDMPASACRPATAKPGASQHQLGLAIDFANCSSRQSACFIWLSGNASRFGYYNLPSEPWHWSTTGR